MPPANTHVAPNHNTSSLSLEGEGWGEGDYGRVTAMKGPGPETEALQLNRVVRYASTPDATGSGAPVRTKVYSPSA